LAFFSASFLVRILLKQHFDKLSDVTIARLYKKGRFFSMYSYHGNMKIGTLVLAFFRQTLLFSVEIRGRGQISNQTGVIA